MKSWLLALKWLFIKKPKKTPETFKTVDTQNVRTNMKVHLEGMGLRVNRLNDRGQWESFHYPGSVLPDDQNTLDDWANYSTHKPSVSHSSTNHQELDFNGGDFGGGGAEEEYKDDNTSSNESGPDSD